METKKNVRITGDVSDAKKLKKAIRASKRMNKGNAVKETGIKIKEALNEIIIML